MSCKCSVCYAWNPQNKDGFKAYDEEAYCSIKQCNTKREFSCDKGSIIHPDKIKKTSSGSPAKRVSSRCKSVYVPFDPERPVLKPYAHQIEALNRYRDSNEIALFFEMGCGKSFTTLALAEDKFRRGIIKGLLVIAPNDVHKQWYDELVHGVDKEHDGVLWQELGVDFEAQCIGGRGGQKELVPFLRVDTFKFVSVNVDTFSTPSKWEEIVAWANSDNYMIALDEATVVKNPNSQRHKRLLYEFNDVVKRGKTILSSRKKHPVRAVLTGTPVTNGPVDLWAIMEFLKPNFFGRNYYSFRTYYSMLCKLSALLSEAEAKNMSAAQLNATVTVTPKLWQGIKKSESYEEAFTRFGCDKDTYLTIKNQDKFVGAFKHLDELKKQLEPVAMFRKLTDCVDMPDITRIVRRVGMSEEQQRLYNQMKKALFVTYADKLMTSRNKLVLALRLQQISSGFVVGKSVALDNVSEENVENLDFTSEEVTWIGASNPKLDALIKDVDECDKPLLILTRFSAEAEKIYELLKDKYHTGLFTGWKVIGGVEALKRGELEVLVANSGKISRGFNLQMSHTTLFYSNTFSMEVRQQAEFRTFRMGQKDVCVYIDYASSEMDDIICSALDTKKGLLEYLRDKDIKELI